MNEQSDSLRCSHAAQPETFCQGIAASLPMELALIRWSVVHLRWDEFSSGNMPHLPAFLAGWFCRQIGTTFPEDVGQFRDSFRAGWQEANQQAAIASR